MAELATPSDVMPEDQDPFHQARQCLERGDYGQVLRELEPLETRFPPATTQGAQLQLLMATAWMGQGNQVRAMACCRQVKRCSDAALRAQARDLLVVLEAPALERPRHWSITLPPLGEAEPVAGRLQELARSRRSSRRPPPSPPPPVGPTRAPIGFAVVVLVLLLLSVVLGGCGAVHAELHFHGPGRLQVGQRFSHDPGAVASPWEEGLRQSLRAAGLEPVPGVGPGDLELRAPVQPAGQALALLASNLEDAARLAGLDLPPPLLHWQERNWLVGVHQRLRIDLDLSHADPIPGAQLSLDLDPLPLTAVHQATPEAVSPWPERDGVRWPLRLGARNHLEVRCWRWSGLGLGALATLLALILALVLARVRRQLGFGLPELPA